MSVSHFSMLKSPTSKRGAQRCAMALIISGQEEPRGEPLVRERRAQREHANHSSPTVAQSALAKTRRVGGFWGRSESDLLQRRRARIGAEFMRANAPVTDAQRFKCSTRRGALSRLSATKRHGRWCKKRGRAGNPTSINERTARRGFNPTGGLWITTCLSLQPSLDGRT